MDSDGGLATAQQILTAAEITVPSGDLADGAYDKFGAYYPLPEHIVSDPVNILEASGLKSADGAEGSGDSKEEPIPEEAQVVRPEDKISIRARRSDGVVKDLLISASKRDSIQVLTIKFTEAAKVSHMKCLENFFVDDLQASTAKAPQDSIYGETATSFGVS
jgi:hypothetical protein